MDTNDYGGGGTEYHNTRVQSTAGIHPIMHLGALVIVVLLLVVGDAVAKDILVLLPFPGYSHTMPFMPIFKELGRRGHNLTMVTPFPQEPTPKGFNQIIVPTNISAFSEVVWTEVGGKPQPGTMNDPFFQIFGLSLFCPVITTFIMDLVPSVLPPLDTSHFDLVITEPFFCMEPLLAAGHLYNAPVVAILPMPLTTAVASAAGNPLELSYVPTGKMPYTNKMNFLERSWNAFTGTMDLLITYLYHYPNQDKYMRQYLPYEGLPYMGDLVKNISLILTLTHFSLNYPRPYARNVLEVAGVSTLKVSPLPDDLEKFVSEAKNGVILFSWGSHFEAEEVDDILEILMTSFSKIKQRVLFKWAYSSIPNTPDNVLIRKWLPQPSILAHNKTVAFISHCGLNSVYEAAYFGVPVIGTALFGDQIFNIRLLEDFGMAINLDIVKMRSNGSLMLEALNKITKDPSYKENALKRMSMLRDRPIPPLDEAVYWIEYVMKYGGTHLQPFSRDMSWYSVTLLDVWTFIITITAIIIYTIYKSILMCISVCKKGSKSSKKRLGKDKKNK